MISDLLIFVGGMSTGRIIGLAGTIVQIRAQKRRALGGNDE